MGTRILLVDDEPLQRKASRLYLEDAGYEVADAAGADEAIRLARASRPDLIISDVLMGEVDGFGLCRRLRDDSNLGRVPVVLVSSHYGRDDIAVASAVGAATLVERTPDFGAELAAVRACLTTQRPRRPTLPDAGQIEAHLRANANQLTRMNEQAKRADERYRLMLDEGYDAIAVLTLDGVVLEVNRRWTVLLGMPASEIIGKHVGVFTPAGQPPTNVRHVEHAAAAGRHASIVPVQRPSDGRIFELEVTSHVVDVGGERQLMTVSRDVTEQLAGQRKLVEAEAMYRSLVDRIPDVVWRLKPDGSVVFVTTNVERMLGLRPAQIYAEGRAAIWLHVHPDDLPALRAAHAAALQGRDQEIEFRFKAPDGRALWLCSRLHVHVEDGGVVVEGMTSDITSRRVLEHSLAHAQKLEAVGQLTGGIAHDFNNLIAVVLANATFLLEELAPNDPRHADALEIQHAAERATALTRQLLAFSRREPLELTDFDVEPAIRGLDKMLRRLIGEHIEIVVRCADAASTVRGELGQLEQVIVNLAVNARDAMPAGGVLAIDCDRLHLGDGNPRGLATGDYVRVRIADTGTGMDDETLAHVFEPFFTTKIRGRGTGLGLSTCYGIVRRMGGSIAVASAPGRGTTFTILLPRVEAGATAAASPVPRRVGGTETILLIEDDPGLRHVLARSLGSQGYSVLAAANGLEAHALVQANPRLALVISDVGLAGETGPDVVARLRTLRPHLRVLYMTGHSDHGALATVSGADRSCLEKPFSRDILAQRVRDALDR